MPKFPHLYEGWPWTYRYWVRTFVKNSLWRDVIFYVRSYFFSLLEVWDIDLRYRRKQWGPARTNFQYLADRFCLNKSDQIMQEGWAPCLIGLIMFILVAIFLKSEKNYFYCLHHSIYWCRTKNNFLQFFSIITSYTFCLEALNARLKWVSMENACDYLLTPKPRAMTYAICKDWIDFNAL